MSTDPPQRTWATTAEVAAAGKITTVTAMDWSKRGVLPPYQRIHGGARGQTARWPLHAPEQAAWVRARLDAGFTFAEIRAMLEIGEFRASSSPVGSVPEKP